VQSRQATHDAATRIATAYTPSSIGGAASLVIGGDDGAVNSKAYEASPTSWQCRGAFLMEE